MEKVAPISGDQVELFPEEDKDSIPDSSVWLDGRDALNLAEFPLASLSNRQSDQKTLEFRDTIFDKQSGGEIERKLTVTASDKYGLPNAVDDEIILALVQLAKKQGFASKTVTFSRYEIIQILGWGKDGWNYQRVLESLERWTSITLKYENAWWDSARNCWVNETFHIIDRLTEVQETDGKERAAFVWNDVLFNSLRAGHLKTLDLEVYHRLTNPTAKRLYRLLDKRFYHRHRVEFDLVQLAYHKLGIAQNYQGNIKQRLEPAIKELENTGIIKPAAKGKRYSKHGVGKWHIIFEQAVPTAPAETLEVAGVSPADTVSATEAALIEVGVTVKKARRLITVFPEEFVLQKIDELKFLLQKGAESVKNPAGFLVKSIEERFTTPTGYKPPAEKAEEEELARKRSELTQRKRQARDDQRREDQEKRDSEFKAQAARVEEYLASLGAEQRAIVCSDAIQREIAKGIAASKWVQEKSKLGDAARQNAITEFVLELLGEGSIKR